MSNRIQTKHCVKIRGKWIDKTAVENCRIPFGATAWIEDREGPNGAKADEAWLFRNRPSRLMRSQNGRPIFDEEGRFDINAMAKPTGRLVRDRHGRYLINLSRLELKDCPLKYLDWLAGQTWLYGHFQHQLHTYLTMTHIEQLAIEAFDPPCETTRGGRLDRREPMPKEQDEEWNYTPVKMTTKKAWEIALDFFQIFESTETDEVPVVDFGELREALKKLPEHVVQKLREAFTTWKERTFQTAERMQIISEFAARCNQENEPAKDSLSLVVDIGDAIGRAFEAKELDAWYKARE